MFLAQVQGRLFERQTTLVSEKRERSRETYFLFLFEIFASATYTSFATLNLEILGIL